MASPAKAPTAAKQSSQEPPEIAEKQANLEELRHRIETMRKELAGSENNKAQAADKLRDSEREISRLQRELSELAGQKGQLQARLRLLDQQSSTLNSTLEQQQVQLSRLLYRQYLNPAPDSLRLILNGGNPSQLSRDLYYLKAIARARAEATAQIAATLQQKEALTEDIRGKNTALSALAEEQAKKHSALQKERTSRQQVFNEISSKVKAQRQEIGSLQQDEQRLTRLIDRLSAVLAARAAKAAKAAAEEAQRKKVASAQAAAKPQAQPTQKSGGEAENRHSPSATSGNFAQQKGTLRLPVRGAITARFGSPREGGGNWRGLFIRAAQGSDVRSIANGTVVFAEWMRGFGNLIIVDHSDGYLSIYGNNDALLKQVGQTIRGGDVIATAGNSGGNPESGLYFELRHQGHPIDPMKWASLK